MKVLNVITLADLGGAQSVVINLAKKAVSDGHEVYVVSESHGPMWEELGDDVVKFKLPSLQRAIDPIKELKTIIQLKKIARNVKPDVIHLHSSKIGLLGRLAFPKKKIIYTVHGFDSIRLAFRKFLPVERMLQNRNKFIVGVSKYDVDGMLEEKITKNITYIYNGISDCPSLKILSADKNAEDFFKDAKEKNNFIILSIARLSSQKKFDLFCDVAKEFEYNEEVKFVWIGNSYQPENLPENVHCLGEIKNAFVYLKYADLFMLPSNYEGLPISILEALSYGVPVIASDVGGVSEVLDGHNGFALPNSVDAFAEKINDFLHGKLDIADYRKAARQSYEKHFTVEKMYNEYKKLYNKIASDNSSN